MARKMGKLTGGTAIALQIGYRHSIDFDLFTAKELNHSAIKKTFKNKGYTIDSILHESSDQIHLLLNGVKLTFFQYPFTIQAKVKFEKLLLPDLVSLSAMKAYVLGRHAKWKDYVDLYFLLKDHLNLDVISHKAKSIFDQNFNEKLFRQQLAWFKDIDYSETIDYLVDDPGEIEIKRFLTDIALTPF